MKRLFRSQFEDWLPPFLTGLFLAFPIAWGMNRLSGRSARVSARATYEELEDILTERVHAARDRAMREASALRRDIEAQR